MRIAEIDDRPPKERPFSEARRWWKSMYAATITGPQEAGRITHAQARELVNAGIQRYKGEMARLGLDDFADDGPFGIDEMYQVLALGGADRVSEVSIGNDDFKDPEVLAFAVVYAGWPVYYGARMNPKQYRIDHNFPEVNLTSPMLFARGMGSFELGGYEQIARSVYGFNSRDVVVKIDATTIQSAVVNNIRPVAIANKKSMRVVGYRFTA